MEPATKQLAYGHPTIGTIVSGARVLEKRGIRMHEGFRFIALGESGSGKTTLMRAVVYATISRGMANFALIHDVKGMFPEYPQSIQLAHTIQFEKRGFLPGELPIVSFRGDPRIGIDVTAEEVAALSIKMARAGIVRNGRWEPNPHVCVIEELASASSQGRKTVSAPSVLILAEQGRKMGVSLVGTTQSPRKTPLDLLGQASCIAFHRLTGADVNYLYERLDLDENMVEAIRGPSGEGLPNYDFVLWEKGKPWDGEIHRLPERLASLYDE